MFLIFHVIYVKSICKIRKEKTKAPKISTDSINTNIMRYGDILAGTIGFG